MWPDTRGVDSSALRQSLEEATAVGREHSPSLERAEIGCRRSDPQRRPLRHPHGQDGARFGTDGYLPGGMASPGRIAGYLFGPLPSADPNGARVEVKMLGTQLERFSDPEAGPVAQYEQGPVASALAPREHAPSSFLASSGDRTSAGNVPPLLLCRGIHPPSGR